MKYTPPIQIILSSHFQKQVLSSPLPDECKNVFFTKRKKTASYT